MMGLPWRAGPFCVASALLLLPNAASLSRTSVVVVGGGGASRPATTTGVAAPRYPEIGLRRTGRRRGRRRRSAPSPRAATAAADDDDHDDRDHDQYDDGVELTNAEISRYSRHLVLGDVGVAGQRALKKSSVLVIGAGGLGSSCLLYLAAAGVGHIGIVDADSVDESNLQRQIIHGTSTIGTSKCESARRRMIDVNPHVDVRVYEEEFTSETAMRILGDGFSASTPRYDVVVDGSDNFPTKYLINDACDILGLPWVYSAVLAFEGQVSTFNHDGGPNYRDLLPAPPPPGDVPSCAEGGVLGVLPGTMGCLQATEVIKIVLGMGGGLLSGRCLTYDATTMKFGEIGIARSPNRKRAVELIDYQGFCAGPKVAQQRGTANAAAARVEDGADDAPAGGRTMDEVPSSDEGLLVGSDDFNSIGPTDCLDKLAGGWSPWVLDVRMRSENDIVALPFTDAVVPHREVRRDHIPKDGEVLIYCKGGVRGKKACSRLVGLGVDPRRLYNLEGGILRWQKEIDPQMPRY
ncbi:hypothetical protein ACHAW5_009301 [Stephanodiscus triporus]|uniref:Rhodanese domain-containing protein n=1 Tax=Stephanodiscus triporus TaxID=2934178 RepID=A0ABD3NN51_9STRA